MPGLMEPPLMERPSGLRESPTIPNTNDVLRWATVKGPGMTSPALRGIIRATFARHTGVRQYYVFSYLRYMSDFIKRALNPAIVQD